MSVPVIGILKTTSSTTENVFVRGQFLVTESKILYKHTCSFTDVSSSLDSTIAVCDTQKNLLIFSFADEGSLSLLYSFKIKKCPTAVKLFNNIQAADGGEGKDIMCYVADKFGHVYIYPPHPEFTSHVYLSEDEESSEDEDEVNIKSVPEESETKKRNDVSKPILGHVSMLTALVVSPSFVITGDRDEKIRVTDRLKPYIIHTLLLHHRTFVSDLLLVSEDLLISGDGNGTLCFWDLKSFSLKKELQIEQAVIQKLSSVNDSIIAVVLDQSCRLVFVNCENYRVDNVMLTSPILACNCGLISCSADSSLYKIAIRDGVINVEKAFDLMELECENCMLPFNPEPKSRLAKKVFTKKQ